MSRSPEGPDSDLLFDLPLDPKGSRQDAEPETASGDSGTSSGASGGDQVAITFVPDADAEPDSPRLIEAPLAPRFTAAALDLVVLVAVLGFSLLTLRLFAVPIDRGLAAPLAVFLGAFSFLYQVVPLAFWGHTPGMAYAGIHSRTEGGDFLTIQQCILRWLGWMLALATAGLGALVALSGVSPADLLSRTRTFVRAP